MAERLTNPGFTGSLDGWTNGVQGGSAFAFSVGGYAKGSGGAADNLLKTYRMKQQISVTGIMIQGLAEVLGKWEGVAGNLNDGSSRFVVSLIKPSGTSVQLVDVTKTAVTGSGAILSSTNILAHLTEEGFYDLLLELYVRSAKFSGSASVTENYSSWVNSGFAIIAGPEARRVAPVSGSATATIKKAFDIDAAPSSAHLTVAAKGTAGGGGARAKVKLVKPNGTEIQLVSIILSGDTWSNIVNNMDISGYLTTVGQYEVKLIAEVTDGASLNFGNVALSASWTGYVQAFGWYDSASLDISVKKTKVVIESMGMVDLPEKKAAKALPLEGITLSESLVTRKFRGVFGFDGISFTEGFSKVVKKVVVEGLKFQESLFRGVGFMKVVSEGLQFLESYLTRRLARRTETETLGLLESVSARVLTGNLIIYPVLVAPTTWADGVPASTSWSKTKIEIQEE